MTTYATILLKPDALEQRMCGELISHFEDTGLKIEQINSVYATPEKLEAHYHAHKGKDFYDDLIAAMAYKPLIAISASSEGDEPAFEIGRRCVNFIREYYTELVSGPRNLVHCSDSAIAVGKEYYIWFCA